MKEIVLTNSGFAVMSAHDLLETAGGWDAGDTYAMLAAGAWGLSTLVPVSAPLAVPAAVFFTGLSLAYEPNNSSPNPAGGGCSTPGTNT